jgi:hypothetical protein
MKISDVLDTHTTTLVYDKCFCNGLLADRTVVLVISWEHKLLKFIVTKHPDCLGNEVTDTDLNELETAITKPEDTDAFYMGSMTYLH